VSAAAGLWVVLPAGQQRNGAWLDDTLRTRSIEAGVAGRAPEAGHFPRQRVERFRGDDAYEQVNVAFLARGWTDGLPVVPPSIGRVEAMAAAAGRAPADVVAELPPLGGVATLEKVAVCAVMAGCAPTHFPFVVAAVEAVADPAFNLRGVQTTDENVAPLLVASGPAAAAAGIHAGMGLLGPGFRANATIGRALRLVLHNLGGGWPGAVSFAGAGQPGRYGLCVAEDDGALPDSWPPLRIELGHRPEETVLVVTRAETAVNVTGGLAEIASVMASAASLFTVAHRGRPVLLLAPATALDQAGRGRSRRDVAAVLAERGRLPRALWRSSWLAEASRAFPEPPGEADIPVVSDPDDLLIVVAGGRIPIPQHVWFPTWGHPPCRVVVPVDRATSGR
jgi:hypothetical protein